MTLSSQEKCPIELGDGITVRGSLRQDFEGRSLECAFKPLTVETAVYRLCDSGE